MHSEGDKAGEHAGLTERLLPVEPTNEARAARIQKVLADYYLALEGVAGTPDEHAEVLSSLLADARHWCDRYNVEFWKRDRAGYEHYLQELPSHMEPN